MTFKSVQNPMFRNQFAEDIFNQKYRHESALTWAELAKTLVDDVCGLPDIGIGDPQGKLIRDEHERLIRYISELKFIPGGRYLYYAGRPKKFFNNCYLLRALEDTREDWADLSKRAETCLATGGGIGVDYSIYRASGSILRGTGGIASGPISKMKMVNEIGREIMQGGSRRSAMYASLNWQHGDAKEFLHCKNWHHMPIGKQMTGEGDDRRPYTLWDAKNEDFNFHAPLDMTNISLNYDTKWLMKYWETNDVGETFTENVRQALSTGEPGFSFNFFDKENETLRNACCEVTSEDDSDVCNLGSVNLSRIDSLSEFADVVNLGTKFLLCGTLVADLPYEKVVQTREKTRRLGLGIMGVHEWLIQRGYEYAVTPELHRWLTVYRDISRATANTFSAKLGISRPVAVRSVAPTGSLGILASTTTGIEPLLAVAYRRRYLKGKNWHYQFVVDGTAKQLIDIYGKDPSTFQTALSLADTPQKRIKFQADVQDYVDMAISSTINLPAWGSKNNNEDTVKSFAGTLASYASRLRGFTCYPDGSRGGQPITEVPYKDAVDKLGIAFDESIQMHDICSITGRGGVCGA
jgi:ribonucleoside-diphosphate reductase alpha chain